jgi:AcrR family transcriptional regulator
VRNRTRVLEAAWRLMRTRRPEEMSMEDVAREAAIGKGTLYRHYPTRECLVAALLDDGAHRLAARLHDGVPPEADAPTKLRAIVTLMYDAYEEHSINIQWMLSTYQLPSLRLTSGGADSPLELLIGRLRAIVEQGQREGSFRPLDADYAALAVLSLLSPAAFAKQQGRLGYTRAALQERAVDLLLHALGADRLRQA